MNPLTANGRRTPRGGFPREQLHPRPQTIPPPATREPEATEAATVCAYLAVLTIGARVNWWRALVLWLAARIVRRLDDQATLDDPGPPRPDDGDNEAQIRQACGESPDWTSQSVSRVGGAPSPRGLVSGGG